VILLYLNSFNITSYSRKLVRSAICMLPRIRTAWHNIHMYS